MPGTLFVVATPIGNLEDISARALRVLREVALIAAEDTRRTAHLLARYAITTPTTSLHEHNERAKTAALLRRLERGEHIALVSDAGTPVVSDPGRFLVEAARTAGFRVEPVPGPSAIVTTLAASGFPADAFVFLGFPPAKGRERSIWLNDLSKWRMTAVFFEAPHRMPATLGEIANLLPEVQVCVGRELTKAHEDVFVAPIETVVDRLPEPVGEFTVALDLGRYTNLVTAQRPGGVQLAAELDEMTNKPVLSRRQAIATLAKRHGLTVNEVYDAIERSKS
jgi:16S rRNA (cytidine1402-2'-O)-methyltransferase